MKLVHSEYDIKIELKENNVNLLVIENRKLMTELVYELYNQCNGLDGRFVLSNDMKELKIDKEASIVLEPFTINCNDRKVISKLYQELEELALENLYAESMELYSNILKYSNELCQMVPYNLKIRSDLTPTDIIKLSNVKIEEDGGSLLEKLVNYLGVMCNICRIKLVIFVNIKTFLNNDELEELYKYANYNKIQLLMIESIYNNDIMCEKTIVIDKDMCIINI